eukprot:1188789-Prorocentrum_minimum.AAC.3
MAHPLTPPLIPPLQEGIYHRARAGAALPVGPLAAALRSLETPIPGEPRHPAAAEAVLFPTVIINQLVSSEASWPEAGVRLRTIAALLPPAGPPAGADGQSEGQPHGQLYATARVQVSAVEGIRLNQYIM